MSEERIIKRGVLITEGDYAGWKAKGPYVQRQNGQKTGQYYRLTKLGVVRHVAVEKLQILGMATTAPDNAKAFL